MIDRSLESLQQENAELHRQIDSLKQQLIDADRLSTLGALASSITHEFNNILTTVINYAKLGLRNRSPEARDKAFDRILAAGQRAAKITSGMLSYSRSRHDRRESTSLAALMNDTLTLVEKDLQVHRISLNVSRSGDPHAEVNAGQIQQVLLNLIINARQAMQPGGSLTVEVRDNIREGLAEIAIRDTGQGIPAPLLPKIFDPFFTTKTADAQGQGGTGLGLATCKEVVERHHGRIRVESAIGRGTVFTIKLPRAAPPRLQIRSDAEETSVRSVSSVGGARPLGLADRP